MARKSGNFKRELKNLKGRFNESSWEWEDSDDFLPRKEKRKKQRNDHE